MGRKPSKRQKSAPVAVGTGLLALDVVFSEGGTSPLGRWAGGTCGNVLTILAFLGWKSFPVARLKKNEEADHILSDLKHWKVSTKLIAFDDKASTPIIIEYIRRTPKDGAKHRFSLRCPVCGSYLPGYRPIKLTSVANVTKAVSKPDVFFFDRVSPAAIALAKSFASKGALIYFEPVSVGDERLFKRALATSHVVKYSRDMLELPKKLERPPLLIETRGKDGVRYRARLPLVRSRDWESLNGLDVPKLKDAAGAGDWFSAGLLSQIGNSGIAGLKSTTKAALLKSLNESQAFAAWSCTFESPRKGMYGITLAELRKRVAGIQNSLQPTYAPAPVETSKTNRNQNNHLCLSCR